MLSVFLMTIIVERLKWGGIRARMKENIFQNRGSGVINEENEKDTGHDVSCEYP